MEEYNKSYGAIKLASLLSHAQSQSSFVEVLIIFNFSALA